MRKLTALVLVLALLLCGCAAQKAPATDPVTEATEASDASTAAISGSTTTPETTEPPTTEATTEPEPVYTNPLSGEVIDAPYTGRIFAATISNVREALPHVGLQDAEIVMEMLVNNSIIRCLALYTDITTTEVVGPVRSTRLMFNDLAVHYDLLPCYAGGSDQVISNLKSLNIDHIHVDTWDSYQFGASFRDNERKKIAGLTYENTLMLDTDVLVEYAESKGFALEREERDYGLVFTEDGIPGDGEAAQEINIRFKYGGTIKDTLMKYDEDLGRYVFWQYNKMMTDGTTGEPETFRNVVVMEADITTKGIYYQADFLKGGTGYYACGGKIVPLTWTCDGDDLPFQFFDLEGEPLPFSVGNSYIAIVPQGSPVTYQ